MQFYGVEFYVDNMYANTIAHTHTHPYTGTEVWLQKKKGIVFKGFFFMLKQKRQCCYERTPFVVRDECESTTIEWE